MTMLRRDFLKRLTVTAAGLLVADDVLAMIAEPRRKVWPVGVQLTGGQDIQKAWRKIQGRIGDFEWALGQFAPDDYVAVVPDGYLVHGGKVTLDGQEIATVVDPYCPPKQLTILPRGLS